MCSKISKIVTFLVQYQKFAVTFITISSVGKPLLWPKRMAPFERELIRLAGVRHQAAGYGDRA